MQNLSLTSSILSAINIADAFSIVVAAGLALIGLAFAAFVLRQGSSAASGRIGDDDDSKDKADD